MTCSSTLPWPCDRPVAGGTHPLATILCARHLAGVLAPPRPPDIDRQALARRHPVDRTVPDKPVRAGANLDVETLEAIVTLAPLGATVQTWYPRHARCDRLRAPYSASGSSWYECAPDDPKLPVRAASTARKAVQSGWRVRLTVVDDANDILLKARRGDVQIAFSWRDGSFAYAWLNAIERLGLNEASKRLETK